MPPTTPLRQGTKLTVTALISRIPGYGTFCYCFFSNHNKARAANLKIWKVVGFWVLQLPFPPNILNFTETQNVHHNKNLKTSKKSLDVSFCFGTRWPAANFITLRLKQVSSCSSVVGHIRQRKEFRVWQSRNCQSTRTVGTFVLKNLCDYFT